MSDKHYMAFVMNSVSEVLNIWKELFQNSFMQKYARLTKIMYIKQKRLAELRTIYV